MAGTKTTIARAPASWFDSIIGVAWNTYGSGDLSVSDDGGMESTPGMTSALQRLIVHGFGFTEADIPRGAKIVGITLRTEGHGVAVGASGRGLRAHLCLGAGVIDGGGSPMIAGATVGNRAAWTLNLTTDTVDVRTTDGTANNGDPLWGFAWTPEAIYDSTFGVVFSSDSGTPSVGGEERSIDHVTIEITYTDPATGYRWHPIVRCVPDNGAEESLDLTTLLTDVHGPTKTDAKYMIEQEKRVTVNRSARVAQFGLRAEIALTLEILAMADAEIYSRIVTRSIDPSWRLYLSMDGGVTEREVYVSKIDGPDPLARKTHVGARFVLGFTTVEIFDEMPAFGAIGFGLGNW